MSLRHVHVPWREAAHWLEQLVSRNLQPEFAFQAADLDRLDYELLDRVAQTLSQARLAVTVHAPFMDLNPGALDPMVKAATQKRLDQALTAAGCLGARLMVVHPGYDHWHYDHNPQFWLDQAVPFFRQLLATAEQNGVRLAVENIFETTPSSLNSLIRTLDHPLLGYCFDIGHWNLFAEDPILDHWLETLADKLIHLHLHDNFGQTDQHLPPGEGNIDFSPLNRLLASSGMRPSMTLEAHSAADLERSLISLPLVLPANC